MVPGIMDHDKLNEVRNVEQGKVENYTELQNLHNDTNSKVGHGTEKASVEDTREANNNKDLTCDNNHAVNIRFHLGDINSC